MKIFSSSPYATFNSKEWNSLSRINNRFSDNPIKIADRWIEEGATRLHIVDLDGAFKGSPTNGQIVRKIKNKYPKIEIQLGGGIRTKQDILGYLNAGVDFLILGTKAVTAPDFLNEICSEFPGKIILGLDALDGKVATHGWEEITQVDIYEFALEAANLGVVAIIFTDIYIDFLNKISYRNRVFMIIWVLVF